MGGWWVDGVVGGLMGGWWVDGVVGEVMREAGWFRNYKLLGDLNIG